MYRKGKSMIHLKRFEFIDMWDEIMYFFSWFGTVWTFGYGIEPLLFPYDSNDGQLGSAFLFYFIPLYSPFSDCIPVFLFCLSLHSGWWGLFKFLPTKKRAYVRPMVNFGTVMIFLSSGDLIFSH